MTHWNNTLQVCKDFISTLAYKPLNYTVIVLSETALTVYASNNASVNVFIVGEKLADGSQERLRRMFYVHRKLN